MRVSHNLTSLTRRDERPSSITLVFQLHFGTRLSVEYRYWNGKPGGRWSYSSLFESSTGFAAMSGGGMKDTFPRDWFASMMEKSGQTVLEAELTTLSLQAAMAPVDAYLVKWLWANPLELGAMDFNNALVRVLCVRLEDLLLEVEAIPIPERWR